MRHRHTLVAFTSAIALSLAGSTTAAGAPSAPPAPAGGLRSVYQLGDNRLSAHVLRHGGLAVDFSGPSFVKYARFARPTLPWRLAVSLDGRRVAFPTIHTVTVELPLTPAQTTEPAVMYLRLKSAAPQRLRVKVNGQALEPAALVPGWQVVRVPLPAQTIRAGENLVELAFGITSTFAVAPKPVRSGAAIEWLQVRSHRAPAPRDDERIVHSQGGRLVLPASGGVAYYLAIEPGVKFSPGTFKAQGACQLHARIWARDGRHQQSFVLRGPGGQGPGTIDLSGLAGDIVRLELWAEPSGENAGPGAQACEEATLEGAALVAAGGAPAVKRPPAAPPPKNILIWLVDSLRADKLKVYNPKSRVETPTLDALAKRGVVFRQHYVQGNESRASHASLWSGLYPVKHRVINGSAALNRQLPTLGKVVRASGRYCALRSANGFVSKSGGFGEGWHFQRNHIRDKEGGGVKAADFARHGIAFLEKTTQPFLLYLGTVDCHVSWRAHEPWVSKYDAENKPSPYKGPLQKGFSGPQLESYLANKLKLSPRDKLRVVALYDSDVSYNDHHLGVLIEKLRATGRLDETMIIVTADHGDELFDHGGIGHGHTLREHVVGVPLIISYPPLFPAGTVVEEGAEVIDVLPTILDALGRPIPEVIQGESLIPLAQGVGRGYPRPSIASQYELAHVMRLGRWKMWVGGGPTPKLFDLESPEMEKKDLAQERAFPRRLLTDAFGLFLAYHKRWHKARWGVASNASPQLAAELEADPTIASR